MFRVAFFIVSVFFIFGCSSNVKSDNEVVVYVSEDRVFSEPILKEFEKKTGIKVRAMYDTEESKSTGVLNRLIAEKDNPQADVYWANEPIRVQILKQKGVLKPYTSKNAKDIPTTFKDKDGYWCGFSARLRVFIVHKDLKEYPKSVKDYTNAKFKNKGVIANPLFGTTTTQIAALYTLWGDKKTDRFLDMLKENHIAVSTGNGESADFVAEKKYMFSLVDSDDAISRIRAKKDVYMVYPDQGKDDIGCLVVPNVVVLIAGAKREQNGKKLIDFLLSKEVESMLAKADCAQIPLHSGVKPPSGIKSIDDIKVMDIDYEAVAKKMQLLQVRLKEWAGY